MNNNFNTIHETVIRDVLDTIKDGISATKSVSSKGYNGSIASASSLSKATNGLTLVFPVLVDGTLPVETSSMISRAVESRAVTMLQIAFSAFNVTTSKDAYDFIKNFHTNIGSGKISMDNVLDALDNMVEESTHISYEEKKQYAAIREDFKHNCNFYLEEDVSESSINDYKILPGVRDFTVVKEDVFDDYIRARRHARRHGRDVEHVDRIGGARIQQQQYNDAMAQQAFNNDLQNRRLQHQIDSDNAKAARDIEKTNHDREREEIADDRYENELKYNRGRDATKDAQWQADYDLKAQRNQVQNAKDNVEMLSKMVLPGDIKKANEMMPTMMVVNFCTTDENIGTAIQRQLIIGVKAKLIPVDPYDVANKILVKHADGNVLLNFLRSTTREISFFKDFLFAIDNAKINALSSSKRGTPTYRYLRVLERRALKGKVRKTLRMDNTAKAMSTLVISSELAKTIKVENHIDLERADIIRPIMEKLNLMIFIIADETGENIKLIMDTGDDAYETISYTHLERDTSSRELRKSINLMTKMNR